jgi:hypothetical protein
MVAACEGGGLRGVSGGLLVTKHLRATLNWPSWLKYLLARNGREI